MPSGPPTDPRGARIRVPADRTVQTRSTPRSLPSCPARGCSGIRPGRPAHRRDRAPLRGTGQLLALGRLFACRVRVLSDRHDMGAPRSVGGSAIRADQKLVQSNRSRREMPKIGPRRADEIEWGRAALGSKDEWEGGPCHGSWGRGVPGPDARTCRGRMFGGKARPTPPAGEARELPLRLSPTASWG